MTGKVKPLLVGDRSTHGGPAFSAIPRGRSGHRLARLLDLKDLREVFDTANVYPTPPVLSGRPFILIAGARAARALRVEPRWLVWQSLPDGTPVAVIPHPSGRNRWWNFPVGRENARQFILAALRTDKSSEPKGT